MAPANQTTQVSAASGTVAPQASAQTPVQPSTGMQPGIAAGTPSSAMPGAAAQPGMPGEMPEPKKSRWWLWVIFGLGVVILLGLVAYFIFAP